MGISSTISQSWLIEHAATQVKNLEATLQVALFKEDFANLLKTAIRDSLLVTQDCTLDQLDFQLREAANHEWCRRSLWVDQTRLSEAIKAEGRCFPVTGD
jgi:hypothetical protein